MGSCGSVHKDPASSVSIRFSIEPKNRQVSVPSSVNAGNRTVGDGLLKSPSRFVDSGNKTDESFFDSQPWLESDCEDDFVSVNGDFTPSRGNTPVHHNFTGNPHLNNAHPIEVTVESLPDQSPDKKKKLSELFKESLGEFTSKEDAHHNLSDAPTKVVPDTTSLVRSISASGTPYLSGADSRASSKMSNSGELREEEKWLKSRQCCLPRLLSSQSFSDKKRTSLAQKDAR